MTYLEMVTGSVKAYLEEHEENRDFDDLFDTLWEEDSVTGVESGSYFSDKGKAKEMVFKNLDDVIHALNNHSQCDAVGEMFLDENWERMDVITRCFFLYDALETALKEI